jgi:hypothetical protein
VALTLGIVLAVLFALLGTAKLVAAPPMRAAAEHLGYSVSQYRGIGVLELAAAAGAIIGPWIPWIGIAVAIGVVLLMLGALLEHARRRDGAASLVVPVVVAAVAVGYGLTLS